MRFLKRKLGLTSLTWVDKSGKGDTAGRATGIIGQWALGVTGLYWATSGCNGLQWAVLGWTELYCIVMGFTRWYWTGLGSARMYWAVLVCNRVAEVEREHGWHPPKSLDSDENFKPEHTLFCRELRFVAIYALFEDLWAKKMPFWVKNSVS